MATLAKVGDGIRCLRCYFKWLKDFKTNKQTRINFCAFEEAISKDCQVARGGKTSSATNERVIGEWVTQIRNVEGYFSTSDD